jgi:serine/threonine protein kinase
MALQPGSILKNRYRIKEQLGRGGMGYVYLAFDQALKIPVAVKENINLDPIAARQFRREAELLASLRHPNLPRVTDHFILEERQYLVMDFIEGEDLLNLALRKPPTVDEVLTWVDAVCDALTYLHTRQPPVIHRDIKPANLKLQPDGSVVLVDFGIAKEYDHAQTSTGARGLTPGFSPPEQYGARHTDARSDQYSLASTLYFLLTGQRPADSIERMIKKTELKSALSLNPSIPKHIDTALNRALALDQDDRYQDIDSFHAALQGKFWVEPIPEEATPTEQLDMQSGVQVAQDTELKTTPRRLRLSRLWVFVAIGILVIGGGAAVVLSGILPGTQPQTTPASAQMTLTSEASVTRIKPPPTPHEVPEDDIRALLDLTQPDFFDYFDDPDTWYDYDSDGSAAYHIEDGHLIGKDYEPEELYIWWSYTSPKSGNVYAEITTTNGDCIAKDSVGLVIRVQADETPSGYALEVSCDGFWRLRLNRGTGTKSSKVLIDWTPSEAINTGPFAQNRLGIWGYQRQFYIFVNDVEIGEYYEHDYTFSYGYFAAYVRASRTFDLEATFDNFAFWHIPYIP